MKTSHFTSCVIALTFALGAFVETTLAQTSGKFSEGRFKVSRSVDELELISGETKRLEFDYDIPDIHVENDTIVRVRPVAANAILIVGVRTGVTAITVSDADGKLQHVQIQVVGDARELQRTLSKEFPSSNVRAIPMKQGVMLTGTIGNPDDIAPIMELAADYFPARVINRTVIDGSQMVAIEVKVYEVSRTKLRRMGVDWAAISHDVNLRSSIAGVISQLSASPGTIPTAGAANITFGVLSGNNQFQSFIDTLEQRDIAKLMDQPTLVAINGRAAEFLSGGEIPIQVASGLGTNSVEFRPFGTRLDLVPKILGNGRIRLEIRAEVSEVANDLSNGSGVPGFRVRRVNTAVAMSAGHTLALAGDYREEEEAQVRGIPYLLNLPAIGLGFRREQDTRNETELVFLIKPRFVGEVTDEQLPSPQLGRQTTSPSNGELYLKGYIEVPNCGNDCPTSQFNPQANLQNFNSMIHTKAKKRHQISDQFNPAPLRSGTPARNSGFSTPAKANSGQFQAPSQKQVPANHQGSVQPQRFRTGFGYPNQNASYSIGDKKNEISYSLPRFRSNKWNNSKSWNYRQASNPVNGQRRY